MGKATGIEWTAHTWNPWQGCAHVSPGCDHCYMFSDKRRYGQDPETVVRSKAPTFNAPLKLSEPGMVFTCSWSDFFIKEADPWRAEAWDIIKRTPHLTYQVLTKRHGRIAKCLPPDWGAGYPNVWLGVSVESQVWAERRIPALLRIPARVRFLSMEPLLEAVDLDALWSGETCDFCGEHVKYSALRRTAHCGCCVEGDEPVAWDPLGWVILGSESGAGARAMDPAWADAVATQCEGSEVATFTKQIATPAGMLMRDRKGGDPKHWPARPSGRPWPRQFPEVSHVG